MVQWHNNFTSWRTRGSLMSEGFLASSVTRRFFSLSLLALLQHFSARKIRESSYGVNGGFKSFAMARIVSPECHLCRYFLTREWSRCV
jgi:hypothetical protein